MHGNVVLILRAAILTTVLVWTDFGPELPGSYRMASLIGQRIQRSGVYEGLEKAGEYVLISEGSLLIAPETSSYGTMKPGTPVTVEGVVRFQPEIPGGQCDAGGACAEQGDDAHYVLEDSRVTLREARPNETGRP